MFIFHYYAASMHDMGNCRMEKSAAESEGNLGEFHSTWRVVTLYLFVFPDVSLLLLFVDDVSSLGYTLLPL